MTLKAKVAVAAAVLLLLAGGTAWISRPGATEANPREPAGMQPRKTMAGAAHSPVEVARTPADAPTSGRPSVAPGTATTAGSVATGRIVDDESGEPVAGAKVTIVFEFNRQEPDKEPAAVTDREGRFRMEGIGERSRFADSLLVTAEGHAEAVLSIYGWGLRAKEGEATDLGQFRLERGASVAGRVLSAEGKPVAGAEVLFCRETRQSFPPSFQPNQSRPAVRTDSAGRFTLDRIPSAEGGFRHTLFAVGGAGFGWLSLPPVAGRKDLADQDVRLAATASLLVTVRGPDGRPVEKARVSAVPHFPPLGAERSGQACHELWILRADLKGLFEGETDSTGSLRLGRLPVDGASCRYDVVANAAGFSRGWTDGVALSPGDSVETAVRLEVARPSVLSGSVRGPGGVAVAGATVNFVGNRSVTDSEGAYRVEGVEPASLDYDPWVTVEAKGFATASRVFQRPEPWDTGGIDFVLEPGVPVRGRVVDEAEKPVAGAQITLQHGNMGIETAHSGADGRFALRSAAVPKTTILLCPPSPATDWEVPDAVKVPEDGGEIQVHLRRAPPGARLVAEILDAGTGLPLDPTMAMLVPAEGSPAPPVYGKGPRLEGGRVTIDRVWPGDWVLWVAAEGRAPLHVPVHVEKGQAEVKARVQYPVPGSVRGRLLGLPEGVEQGRAVYLSLVDVRTKPQWARLQSDPKWIDAARVEEDGTFQIEGAPPGRLRIRANIPGFRGETEVEVLAGTGVDAVIRLVAQGRATFRPAGPPPQPAVLVRLASGDGAWGPWTHFAKRDDSIPEWTADVPPGRVRWQARFTERGDGAVPEGPVAAEGEFEAKAGEVVEVPIPVR